MLTRRTLNARQPRTLQDAARDPYDWWEAPAAPGAERHFRAANVATVLLAVACILALAAPAVLHLIAAWRLP